MHKKTSVFKNMCWGKKHESSPSSPPDAFPPKQQLNRTTNVVAAINLIQNWITDTFKRWVLALFIWYKEFWTFPFASFIWLCFNPAGFSYVPGYSNVRTVADNGDQAPSFGFEQKSVHSEPFGHWLHRWKMAEIWFSDTSSSCPRNVRYSTLACLWEKLREF